MIAGTIAYHSHPCVRGDDAVALGAGAAHPRSRCPGLMVLCRRRTGVSPAWGPLTSSPASSWRVSSGRLEG